MGSRTVDTSSDSDPSRQKLAQDAFGTVLRNASIAAPNEALEEEKASDVREPAVSRVRLKEKAPERLPSAESDLSRAQQATARGRESQIRSALELAQLGPWEYDILADRFLFNDYFYALFRTTADEQGGYTMSAAQYVERFVHPEDRECVGVETRRALETEDPNYEARTEHRILYPDGTVGYISVAIVVVKDEHGRTVKTYGVNQNVTERVRAQRELEEAHDLLRMLHENVDDALFSVDVINNKMLYASPGHARVFGLPAQAFYENPMLWYELTVPEDKPSVDTANLVLWKGERLVHQFRIVHADGQLRWLETRVKPTLDASGRLIRLDGMAIDITERMKEDEKRAELEAQLRHAQRFESLGTLAGGIAHDFNNILGIIVGYTAILKRSKRDEGVLSMALEAISRATKRGSALVSQLLTVARKTDVTYSSVDVNEIIHEIEKVVEQTFPKTIRVTLQLDPKLPEVYGSTTQIHQLLLNLSINARDAMPNGGVLTIGTARAAGDLVRKRFPGATASEYVAIQVRDTGTGMSKATRQRIFEPFFTTKGPGKGTGLGLAVTFGIIESHQGHIAVDSELGRGTTFTIYLRLSEQHISAQARGEHACEPVPNGTEQILLIEDEELLRSMLKSVLESYGYSVLTAEDGSKGVEAFESHRDVDAVISDLGLPEMNGAEVVRRIKAIDDHAKCIITSGSTTPDLTEKLERLGVTRIVSKPFEPAEVLRVLRRVLDQTN